VSASTAAERWPKTTFVDGVKPAIARAPEIAGEKNVTLASPNVIAQALELGLVDEICVSLVPVLFGEGISYFSKLNRGHRLLEDPVVVQGDRALHLTYPVRRGRKVNGEPRAPPHARPQRASHRCRPQGPKWSDLEDA
jgi:hypothetical protein